MRKEKHNLVNILAWLVFFIAALWAVLYPDFEPIIALVTSLLAAITLQTSKHRAGRYEIDSVPEVIDKDLDTVRDEPEEVSPVIKLAERFLEVFEAHGIHLNEIPRCIPENFGISLVELANKDKLIEKLTPNLIDWMCSTFSIRRDWLEVNGSYIYDTENYYKNEYSLLRLLKNLKEEYYDSFKVIAFKSVKELDYNSEHSQGINLLLVVPAFKVDDKVIVKYIPTSTQWDWGYWRSRYQFKGITRVCHKKLGIMFKGHDLTPEKMDTLSSGMVFPKSIIDEIPIGYTWYPDDYTDKEIESLCAKETHETYSIFEYIEEQRYESVLSDDA